MIPEIRNIAKQQMKIEVDYISPTGVHQSKTYSLSRLALIKHLGFAGQGYSMTPRRLLRTLGMFIHYSQYLQTDVIRNNHFSEPPSILYNPTEKSHFSNHAGTAMADFLSKRIDGSFLTVTYESVLRAKGLKSSKTRPDLIAFAQNSLFAIEAKGYSGGSGNMVGHKAQA